MNDECRCRGVRCVCPAEDRPRSYAWRVDIYIEDVKDLSEAYSKLNRMLKEVPFETTDEVFEKGVDGSLDEDTIERARQAFYLRKDGP